MPGYPTDEAHAVACVRKYGTGRNAVRSCARCKWLKNKAKWMRQCCWLIESASNSWGLGCRICHGHPGHTSSWTECTVGSSGFLQVEDLKRHGQTAMHLQLSGKTKQAVPPGVVRNQDSDDVLLPTSLVPTAAQIRLSIEVARCPFGGQGAEFQRKAELGSRADPVNFPEIFNNRNVHARIIKCINAVLYFGFVGSILCSVALLCV